MKKKIFTVICLSIVSIFLNGCGSGGGGGSSPTGGFGVRALRHETSQTTGSTLTLPGRVVINAQFIEPQGTTAGTLTTVPTTDVVNIQWFENRKVPGKWRFTYQHLPQVAQLPCQVPTGQITEDRNVRNSEYEPFECQIWVFPLTINPNSVDITSPPSSIEISMEGVIDTHGQPRVLLLNEYGQVVGNVAAAIVPNSKPKIQFSLPNVSSFPNGVYSVSVNNIKADGTWDVVGVGELVFFGNVPPPPPPGGPITCRIPAPTCIY